MKTLNILIVEDDANIIKSYQRNITSKNLDLEEQLIQIVPKIINDKEEALEVLSISSYNFDAAIVDLKLDRRGVKDDEYSGNIVLKEIKKNLRFPVFVISGTPEQLDTQLQAENSFFKIRTRGEEGNYLDEILNIYNTGITKILGRAGKVEEYLSNIYWNHLSTSMDSWLNDNTRSAEQKEQSLLRYTLLHMQEYIDEELEKYHPSEFYITKPIKKSIFTGDIMLYENERYIVLTPSCDIICREDGTRNADFVLFCKIKRLEEIVESYNNLNAGTSISNRNRKRLTSYFENKKQKFHFIPKSNSIEPGLIDFQDKLTLSNDSVNGFIESGKIQRVATVSQPFLKDIIARYSIYYSRQGSPDFNSEELYQSIFPV